MVLFMIISRTKHFVSAFFPQRKCKQSSSEKQGIYLNHQMLSSVIYTEYEGGGIAVKIYSPHKRAMYLFLQ